MRWQPDERERIVVAIGAFVILLCLAYAAMPFSIAYHVNTGHGILSFVGPIDVNTHCGSALVAGVHHDLNQCEDAARSRLLNSIIFMFLTVAATFIVIKLVLPALPGSDKPETDEPASE